LLFAIFLVLFGILLVLAGGSGVGVLVGALAVPIAVSGLAASS